MGFQSGFTEACLPVSISRHLRLPRAFKACLAVVLALSSLGHGQSSSDLATVEGYVTDEQGHPIAKVTISAESSDGKGTQTTRTDANGRYRLKLPGGTYQVRAQVAGHGQASSGHIAVGAKETKRIDLRLGQAPAGQSSSPGSPEFYDEPQFTVAGVTDTTNLGGHASSTMAPASESLTKEVAGFGRKSVLTDRPTKGDEQLARAAADREPDSFEATRTAGKVLAENGSFREAVPYLERASRLRPDDYANLYELARAYRDIGELEKARKTAQSLLAKQDKAELHQLLGDVEEKAGNPLQAVREYQRAAEMDPSELNLFDWGAELLMHRAFEPAIEVFSRGIRGFPRSARMLTGLGIARYGQGNVEEAVRWLCEAADLNAGDPGPYLLLGKIQSGMADASPIHQRLKRFAELEPDNALANYYYAVALWKQHRRPDAAADSDEVVKRLQRAVQLDPKLAEAYVQQGIVYSERKDFTKAIPAYQKAIEINSRLEQAHYRLAQAYSATGEKLKAQQEIELYKQGSKEAAAEAERERREMRQFVYTMQGRSSSSQPQ